MSGRVLTTDAEFRGLLEGVRTIAMVGLSPKPHRASHQVASYLNGAGFRVLPVHPAGGERFGEPVHGTLTAALESSEVDLVSVFRRPEALPDLVEEAVALAVPAMWWQLGVVHAGAERRALAGGIDLVVDRCLAVEHRRLFG